MSCRVFVLAALSVSLALATSAVAAPPPVEVTTCGQVVPPGRQALLTTDLVCETTNGALGVALGRAAKLDMQGHTITGGVAAVACLPVQCDGTWCGPTKSGRCEVSNGTITGARYEGIAGAQVMARNVTFTDNFAYAVLAFYKADLIDCDIAGSPNAVQAITRVRLTGTTVDGGYVVSDKKVELRSSSVSNAEILGVYGRDVRLIASSVTGNGTDPRCFVTATCGDIGSVRPPSLDGTSTCEHSLQLPPNPPEPVPSWGVCTLD